MPTIQEWQFSASLNPAITQKDKTSRGLHREKTIWLSDPAQTFLENKACSVCCVLCCQTLIPH